MSGEWLHSAYLKHSHDDKCYHHDNDDWLFQQSDYETYLDNGGLLGRMAWERFGYPTQPTPESEANADPNYWKD